VLFAWYSSQVSSRKHPKHGGEDCRDSSTLTTNDEPVTNASRDNDTLSAATSPSKAQRVASCGVALEMPTPANSVSLEIRA
jgi:hypothetical protein